MIAKIATVEEYQQFLDKLEIGTDGTIFSPFDKYQDNAHNRSYYGLSCMLKNAFWNIHENDNPNDYLELSFEAFLNYVNNAREILTDMNYFSGDRLYENNYCLEIYENPKNYSVVDFKTLFSLSDQEFISSFDMNGIIVSNHHFIGLNEEEIYKSDYANLTPREREAFYGEKAKKSLGIGLSKEKVRTKEKKLDTKI